MKSLAEEKGGREGDAPGLILQNTLKGHSIVVTEILWLSSDRLVSASADKSLRLWNAKTGSLVRTFTGHKHWVTCASVSPDEATLVSGAWNGQVLSWNIESANREQEFSGGSGVVWSVSVSPNGQQVASASDDGFVRVWNIRTGARLREYSAEPRKRESHVAAYGVHAATDVQFTPDNQHILASYSDGRLILWNIETGTRDLQFHGHAGAVHSIMISPDGELAFSASEDRTIRVWSLSDRREIRVLEGHTGAVAAISLSRDQKVLVSKSPTDHSVRLWNCDTWSSAGVLREAGNVREYVGLCFDPNSNRLATLGDQDTSIRIWNVNQRELRHSSSGAVQYVNAKVVLVGDSGVGKSGLGLVLSRMPFEATESTHARHVRLFDSYEVALPDGRQETRETLLWDLAGQPGYRLIHQLHLDEVAVALIVFDSRSELDPFSGVGHWDRAIRQAMMIQDRSFVTKRFLVSARADRGGVGVSKDRLDKLLSDYAFDGYFETSAKEGWSIDDLIDGIRKSIPWGTLPRVNSNELFQKIKDFLVGQKRAGNVIVTTAILYNSFCEREAIQGTSTLRAQFDTCIGRVEARGLIRRLRFGGLVLLQPELLDAYASAIVNAAKDEPDGLGCVSEELVQACNFRMPKDERISNRNEEELLLIATIEDLLRREVALREQAQAGALLVFPTQFTRDWEEAPDPPGKSLVVSFEGQVLSAYATLAVRLARSGMFKRDQMWRNAAAYRAKAGGQCGIYLREFGEGRGEITVFYRDTPSRETQENFEEFLISHLQTRVLQGSLMFRRVLRCTGCDEPVQLRTIQLRSERGYADISCSICDTKISIPKDAAGSTVLRPASEMVSQLNYSANVGRDRSADILVVRGKMATCDYDVFLCHNSEDKAIIREIGLKLKARGILPWLDEWELRPGLSWQRELERILPKVKSAAVFVGKSELGPWQRREIEALLREFTNRGCPVIPTLLPDYPTARDTERRGKEKYPKLPLFLGGHTWVDFRRESSDPISKLIWGITGQRDRHEEV